MPAGHDEAQMPKRPRPNYRLVKIHYSYSVEDVTALFGIHKNTVREWLRRGLATIDKKRPLLILGTALARFLKARRDSAKRPCGPGQLYCMKCREPRSPSADLVEFKVLREPIGNLTAICPTCGSLMYRRANRHRLPAILAEMAGPRPMAESHIRQSFKPTVNHDFIGATLDHDESQPAQ
jgi:hypothetical protein